MDEKSVNSKNNRDSGQQSAVNKNSTPINNDLKSSAIKVPRKEVVVSDNSKSTKTEDRKLKQEQEKQKTKSEQLKKKQQKQQQQEKMQQDKQAASQNKELQKQLEKKQQKKKQQKKKQIADSKKQKLEDREFKNKQREQLKKQKQKEKLEKQNAPKRDFALNNLTELENRLLLRKETQEQRKKRFLIIGLSVALGVMVIIGSFTAAEIIEDQKPQPIAVKIEVEVDGLDRTPIDPNHPELGYITEIVYPGDSISVNFYVYNTEANASFPVYIRFRAYIILDELSEHSVFDLHFIDEPIWFSLLDENGLDLDIDDWYYYGGLLEIGEEHKLQIISGLTIRTDVGNYFQGRDFTIMLQIQAIEGHKQAVEDFEEWWLAPEEWFDFMGIDTSD